MSAAFDPTAFENSVTSEASSTSVTPIPAGEQNSIIEDYKFVPYTNGKTGESGVRCDISYSILDDTGAIQAHIGRPPRLTKGNFVDLDANGGFDFSKGKNVWLGKIREALGQNVPGQPWSFPMLKGQAIRLILSVDGEYNNIKGWGKPV